MGTHSCSSTRNNHTHAKKKVKSCLVKVNLVNPKLNQSPVHQELVSNSQWAASTASSVKETTLNVSVLVLQFTWLLFWNIFPLKFWNWLVMLQEITRKPESSQDICNWLLEMMKN